MRMNLVILLIQYVFSLLLAVHSVFVCKSASVFICSFVRFSFRPKWAPMMMDTGHCYGTQWHLHVVRLNKPIMANSINVINFLLNFFLLSTLCSNSLLLHNIDHWMCFIINIIYNISRDVQYMSLINIF